jgi:hypothetical protein
MRCVAAAHRTRPVLFKCCHSTRSEVWDWARHWARVQVEPNRSGPSVARASAANLGNPAALLLGEWRTPLAGGQRNEKCRFRRKRTIPTETLGIRRLQATVPATSGQQWTDAFPIRFPDRLAAQLGSQLRAAPGRLRLSPFSPVSPSNQTLANGYDSITFGLRGWPLPAPSKRWRVHAMQKLTFTMAAVAAG